VSAWTWLGVAVLGGTGALIRFGVGLTVARRFGRAFPYGTLTINLTGAFALGLLEGLGASTTTVTLAGTATLGAYTTFSTWMLETERLAEEQDLSGAVLYVTVSVLAGFGAALGGRALGLAL
jgi:CrcB protein